MKKCLQMLTAALLCGVLLFAFVGCGYEVEGQVPRGEEGSMLFLGVNYNRENSLSDGVKLEVNFAHENVSVKDVQYSIYSYTKSETDGYYSAGSLYGLPYDFATSEDYNAKSVNKEEFLPGMFAYSCKFPQKAVEITLPAELFAGESGSFSIVLAPNDADFSDLSALCAYELDYTVDGDAVTLNS